MFPPFVGFEHYPLGQCKVSCLWGEVCKGTLGASGEDPQTSQGQTFIRVTHEPGAQFQRNRHVFFCQSLTPIMAVPRGTLCNGLGIAVTPFFASGLD